jgi:hypothetical protein
MWGSAAAGAAKPGEGAGQACGGAPTRSRMTAQPGGSSA